MKRGVLHIICGLASATPAMALTPVPMCSGVADDDKFTVWNAENAQNGYVTYQADHENNDRVLVVLEHCKTGKSVVAKARWDRDEADADHVDNVSDAMNDFIHAKTSYSLRQIVSGLKGRGIKARLKTQQDESCGCSVFYPNDRGNRTPYK